MRTTLALLLATTGIAVAEPAFELGVGGGAFWGHDDIDITRTSSLFLQGSFRVRGKLDVIAGFDGFTGNYSPEPTNEQSVVSVFGGIRWYPYGRTQEDDIEPRAIYVQAIAGVSLLTLIPYDSFFESNDPDAAGAMGGASLGWMPVRPGNVAIGFEARGELFLYNADAGFRQALSLDAILQLHFD